MARSKRASQTVPVAGRNGTEAVELLIGSGADLTATALDSGTPLHQAAWFGQPENAYFQRLLDDVSPQVAEALKTARSIDHEDGS